MKVLGELCQCWLCSCKNGGFWYPCGCPVKETDPANHPHDIQGVQVNEKVYPIDKVVHTGGRRALWIYLEDGEFAEMVNYPTFYKVGFPASTCDGFLGVPQETRSSTRAHSAGLTSGRSNPTLYKFIDAFTSLSWYVPHIGQIHALSCKVKPSFL